MEIKVNTFTLFHFSLFITLFISFFIFISAIFMNNNTNRKIYSAWQFPMLLAIFLESYFVNLK